MSTIGKLAVRRVHTGDFKVDQQQRLAQQAAQKLNSQADMLNALVNRGYSALATDTGNVAAAAYATIVTVPITTVLSSGYLLIHASASGTQNTTAGSNFIQVLVDGVVVKGAYTTVTAGWNWNLALVVRKAVTRGVHSVLLQWKTNVATSHISAATVAEEHAALLVQEAA